MVITLLGVWVWNSCEVRAIVRWYGSSVSGREWWSTHQCWWWISICTIVPCWHHRGSLKYKVTRLRNSWVWPYQPIVHLEELHSNSTIFYDYTTINLTSTLITYAFVQLHLTSRSLANVQSCKSWNHNKIVRTPNKLLHLVVGHLDNI